MNDAKQRLLLTLYYSYHSTRKALLSKNLDMMANLRLCSCLNPDGSGNLLAQLRQAGRADNVEYRLGSRAIELEQVFTQPWAKSKEHKAFYCSTIRCEIYCSNSLNDVQN